MLILFFIIVLSIIAINKYNNPNQKIDISYIKYILYLVIFISIISLLIDILTFNIIGILNVIFNCIIFSIILAKINNYSKKNNNNTPINVFTEGKRCTYCNSLNHMPREYCFACGESLSKDLKNEEYSPYVVDTGEKLIRIRRLTQEDLVMPINDKFMLGLHDKPKEKEISDSFDDTNHNHKESFENAANQILNDIYSKKYGTYIGYVVETSKRFIVIALCNDCISSEKWNITSSTKKHDYRPELSGSCYIEIESDKDMNNTFYIELKIVQENKDDIIKMSNKHSGQHPHEYMIYDSLGEHTNYGLL